MNQESNSRVASERPNAGRERVIYAESTDYIYVLDHVNGTWEAWERADDGRDGVAYSADQLPDDAGPLYDPDRWPHPDKARADAAEAKLADSKTVRKAHVAEIRRLAAERDTWESEYERVRDTKLTELVDAQRERDEARENLAESLREYGDVTRLLGEARTRLGGFETYLSRVNAELDEWAERDERFRPLIESVRAITVPVTDREEPASAWDVEADTHRISEDHEEPACDGVCRNLGCSGDCQTASEEPAQAQHLVGVDTSGEEGDCLDDCPGCAAEASEEPAGETKPPRGDGGGYIRKRYGVPAEIGRKILFEGKPGEIVGFEPGGAHMYAVGEFGYTEPVLLHPTWEVEYLDDSGRPVERQADSEAQR